MAIAAERGDLAMLEKVHEAAVHAVGMEAQLALDCPGMRQRTPVMIACHHGHTSCLGFLLRCGADPTLVTYNARHETALHLAAAAARHDCVAQLLRSTVHDHNRRPVPLHESVNHLGIPHIDMVNGAGLSALHLATLSGSSNTVKALIQLGADIACQVAGGRSRPVSNWMCAGSTPLHLACARGFPAIAAVLLDAQTETPGAVDLRRMRNSRGLKPSQCARLEGHHDLARLLHNAPSPAPLVRRRGVRAGTSELAAAAPTLEALMQLLVARAQLLLSLRSAASSLQGGSARECSSEQSYDSGEGGCAEAGAPAASGDAAAQATAPALDVLQLLASLEITDAPAQRFTDVSTARGAGFLSDAHLADPPAGSSSGSFRYYAATVLIQAALDAISTATLEGHRSSQPLSDRVSTSDVPPTGAGLLDDEWLAAGAEAEAAADERRRRRRRRFRGTSALSIDELFPAGEPTLSQYAAPEGSRTTLSVLERWRRRQRRRQQRDDIPTVLERVSAVAEALSRSSNSFGRNSELRSAPAGAGTPITASRRSLDTGAEAAPASPSSRSMHISVLDGSPLPNSVAPNAPLGCTSPMPNMPGLSTCSGHCSSTGSIHYSHTETNTPAIEPAVQRDALEATGGVTPAISATLPSWSDSGSSSGEERSDAIPAAIKPSQGEWGGEGSSGAGEAVAVVAEADGCAICMDSALQVSIAGCGHGLCLHCAYRLCTRGLATPACPFCRAPIDIFQATSAHGAIAT
eukprot:CAMPEP_0206136432 /NCGR_PEP_ID=MMETSP1473-20131121/1666_1 /ASSEMBLY_ACC=CAM_ASM_001109 /TAXON_ID=1461547 /ORGANISM="Stichococcus sp, Strain RCC1054" /LENGTH=747 /DNA_ID=CAMNT_0053528967 /DNA_START=387 /DNA_END=2630 /DNA_ORIENTATION=-